MPFYGLFTIPGKTQGRTAEDGAPACLNLAAMDTVPLHPSLQPCLPPPLPCAVDAGERHRASLLPRGLGRARVNCPASVSRRQARGAALQGAQDRRHRPARAHRLPPCGRVGPLDEGTGGPLAHERLQKVKACCERRTTRSGKAARTYVDGRIYTGSHHVPPSTGGAHQRSLPRVPLRRHSRQTAGASRRPLPAPRPRSPTSGHSVLPLPLPLAHYFVKCIKVQIQIVGPRKGEGFVWGECERARGWEAGGKCGCGESDCDGVYRMGVHRRVCQF